MLGFYDKFYKHAKRELRDSYLINRKKTVSNDVRKYANEDDRHSKVMKARLVLKVYTSHAIAIQVKVQLNTASQVIQLFEEITVNQFILATTKYSVLIFRSVRHK